MIPDKCPKCGALGYTDRQGDDHWACGSHTAIDLLCQSRRCIERQRDQLAAENAALRERVKRLEEAGDFMELCLTHNEPFRSDAKAKWHKAKESKP